MGISDAEEKKIKERKKEYLGEKNLKMHVQTIKDIIILYKKPLNSFIYFFRMMVLLF